MKTKSFIVAAAALTLVGGSQAFAHGSDEDSKPVGSPKAQEMAICRRTVAGETPDLLDRSLSRLSLKLADQIASRRTVPGITPEYRNRSMVGGSPKSFEREPWRAQEFQMAPAK